MTIVRQVLQEKGKDVWSVSPKTTLREALTLMKEKKIGAVLVLEDEQIVGIFSERDCVRELASVDSCSLEAPVEKLMTRLVFYIPPDLSIEDCMAMMTEKRIRHLPVVETGKLVGIISIGDVVKTLISQKDITIRSMENYIMGKDYNR